MLRELTNWLCNPLFRADRKNRFIILAILLAIISPVILISAFSYIRAYRDLTDATLSRRQAIAYLTAATLKGNLDRLIDIGTSLATRVRFRQLIGEGKWDEAVKILRSIPKDFPFIDRLFLSDVNGTLMADTPELPEVKGRNFASRDWYRGVSSKWEPYISEVYKRAAEPRLNVVTVAIPIKTEHQKILGILILQVRLDTLFEWTKGIDVGPLGFAYFVDKNGHVAAHPSFSPQGEIVDYSKVPAVQKVLQGKRGVEIAFNPVEREERIAAYEPVPGYGWGVIAQQPTLTAFVARDSNLRGILIAYGSISLLSAVLAYLIVRAFTERNRAEEQTRKLNAELENANKELESFSYSVSHDLRAPLRHIAGYSEMLKKRTASSLDDKSVHYLNAIIESAGHMGNLIDDLLSFSRIARTEVQRTTMSLDELVQETLKDFRTDMKGRTIAWKIDPLPRVEGDPPMLRLVFTNLISNALKFTRTRPEAKIEIGTLNGSGGEAIVFIRDNGVGFDMQYVDKLFGVFQRLHRADEFEGTGVGLASVRRIIERHGGRVWAEGSVGGGATFYLSLPGL